MAGRRSQENADIPPHFNRLIPLRKIETAADLWAAAIYSLVSSLSAFRRAMNGRAIVAPKNGPPGRSGRSQAA
jgi:hypothetical protein